MSRALRQRMTSDDARSTSSICLCASSITALAAGPCRLFAAFVYSSMVRFHLAISRLLPVIASGIAVIPFAQPAGAVIRQIVGTQARPSDSHVDKLLVPRRPQRRPDAHVDPSAVQQPAGQTGAPADDPKRTPLPYPLGSTSLRAQAALQRPQCPPFDDHG